MKTTDARFKPGISDKNWFKKGHRLSLESIEKMRKSKTKYTSDELKRREKDRAKDPLRLAWKSRYEKSPGRLFGRYKFSAKFKHISFVLTLDEFLTFWNKPCNYCGDSIKTIGLDRIDSKLGYELDNLVSCCKTCNYMKREMQKEVFFAQCLKIVNLNQRS